MTSRSRRERERRKGWKRERDRCQAARDAYFTKRRATPFFHPSLSPSSQHPLRRVLVSLTISFLPLSAGSPTLSRSLSLLLSLGERGREASWSVRGRLAQSGEALKRGVGVGWRRRQSSLSRGSVGESKGPREAADAANERRKARGAARVTRVEKKERERDRARASLFDVDATGLAQNSCSVLVERRRAATGPCRRALRHRSTDLRYARDREREIVYFSLRLLSRVKRPPRWAASSLAERLSLFAGREKHESAGSRARKIGRRNCGVRLYALVYTMWEREFALESCEFFLRSLLLVASNRTCDVVAKESWFRWARAERVFFHDACSTKSFQVSHAADVSRRNFCQDLRYSSWSIGGLFAPRDRTYIAF